MTTRRTFLVSIPALAAALPAAVRGMAQSAKRSIPLRAINHVTVTVRDPKRSLEFYQGLFGLPIQSWQGNSVFLRIGSGPQFIGISGTSGTPRISHFCVTTPNFDSDHIFEVLAEHGVSRIEYEASGSEAAGSGIGPLKAWLRYRREDRGGSAEGTPELHFADPEGILAQIQDATYCGGSGAVGEVCLGTPEPAPTKGRIALEDYNHITLGCLNPQRERAFYRAVFGMPILSRPGNTDSLQVGSGNQSLATGPTTANGGTPGKPNVAHICFAVPGFDLDKVRKALTDYGLKPGKPGGAAPPMTHYVSLRMPDRGGAPEGTPELYVTDPDGLVLQLQDTSYCGGAGVLGNVCG